MWGTGIIIYRALVFENGGEKVFANLAGFDLDRDFLDEPIHLAVDLFGDLGEGVGHEEEACDEVRGLGVLGHVRSFHRGFMFYYKACDSCECKKKVLVIGPSL